MFKLFFSVVVILTIGFVAMHAMFHNDIADSLQQLGCLMNGTCTSNE